jgi:antitoxin component YwqK of YwqJK toxin-antitoxin module
MSRPLLLFLIILGVHFKVPGQDKIYYLSDSTCKKRIALNLDTMYYPPQESKSGCTIIYYDHISSAIFQRKKHLGCDSLVYEWWYRNGQKKAEDSSGFTPYIWDLGTSWYPDGTLKMRNHMINDSLQSYERFYRNGQMRSRNISNVNGKLAKAEKHGFEIYREYWWKNGQLNSQDSEYYNTKHHHISYHPNGKIGSDYWVVSRSWCCVGKYNTYYDNGVLSTDGQYKDWDLQQAEDHKGNREETGTWKYYDRDGKMVKTVIYAKEELPKIIRHSSDTTVTWYEQPPPKSETFFFNGYTEKSDPFAFNQAAYIKSAMDNMKDDE